MLNAVKLSVQYVDQATTVPFTTFIKVNVSLFVLTQPLQTLLTQLPLHALLAMCHVLPAVFHQLTALNVTVWPTIQLFQMQLMTADRAVRQTKLFGNLIVLFRNTSVMAALMLFVRFVRLRTCVHFVSIIPLS